MLGRRAEPGGDQQGAELVTIQGDGMRLVVSCSPRGPARDVRRAAGDLKPYPASLNKA
jgi:hypothetical protein